MHIKNIGIVGGSLNGLITAYELYQRGFKIHIFEASDRLNDFGAGLMLDPDFASSLPTLKSHAYHERIVLIDNQTTLWKQPLRKRSTSWGELYRALRSRIPDQFIFQNKKVTAAINEENQAKLIFTDGSELSFDLIIGADGIGSIVRQSIEPNFKISYCGYLAMRGLLALDQVPNEAKPLIDHLEQGHFINIWGFNTHAVCYLLPGETTYLNWMWYRNTHQDELHNMLVDKEGKSHQWTLPYGKMATLTRELLTTEARHALPSLISTVIDATVNPFLQVISQGICKQYFNKRLVLVGDAAHLAVPHIGASVSLGYGDAVTLAEALTSEVDLEKALNQWSNTRYEKAAGDLGIAYRLGQALQKSNIDWTLKTDINSWWQELTAGRKLYFE